MSPGSQRLASIDAVSPERAVDLIDIYAFVEALALLFGQIGEARQKLLRQIRLVVGRIEERAGVALASFNGFKLTGSSFSPNSLVGPVRLADRVQIDESALTNFRRDLRKPGEGDQRRRIRNLRRLVEEYRSNIQGQEFSRRDPCRQGLRPRCANRFRVRNSRPGAARAMSFRESNGASPWAANRARSRRARRWRESAKSRDGSLPL